MAYSLFTAFGIELEYMIVDAATLDVLPITDRLLSAISGNDEGEVERPAISGGTSISWSNELTLHVVELKTTQPARGLAGLSASFDDSVRGINDILRSLNARLMPAAMHPWMDPYREMRLWPHDNAEFYKAFDRIFDCRGHGWANLQSVHLNLPFDGDEEFGRLHAAIRLVLPLLPALCASSPILDGRATGLMDNRLNVYKSNARKVPAVSGRVIPEAAFSRAEYERVILDRIYHDLAPHDPDAMLRHEWANARGAIARFARDAIEIRVMDVQECPAADIAICTLVSAVVRSLVQEQWTSYAAQRQWGVEPLVSILDGTIRDADASIITSKEYLACFGIDRESASAAGVWEHLLGAVRVDGIGSASDLDPIRNILKHGPLARRIVRAVGKDVRREQIGEVYGQLSDCLARGGVFTGV